MIPSTRALLALVLAASLPAQALQTLVARDGETVVARISQKDATRIAFERGRVRRVTGNAGEFVLEKDEDRGHVYLRPTASDATKPINVYVSSDRATVGLLLQPVDTPGDSLVIRERHEPEGPRAERSQRHVRTVKHLLLAMATDAIPDDFEVRESGVNLALWPGLRMTLLRTYLGHGIVGEKYLLANTATGDAAVAARDLYKPGVMAVSVEGDAIPAGEAVNAYVIRERRPHD